MNKKIKKYGVVERNSMTSLQNECVLDNGSFFPFPITPTLEHRALANRFVSLQFLNPKTVRRTLWTGDQPVLRPLPTQDNTNTE
jgi:hypothetical protein